MRFLFVAVLLTGMLAGCVDEPTQETLAYGQIDGAALNHVLVPYPDVVVTLPEIGRETRTTELGGFTFFDIEPGFYVVELYLPGIGIDREVVAVRSDEISRVILQIYPQEEEEPHVTFRSNMEIVQLAMPGERCEECDWRTSLSEGRPEAAELLVEWDARHPAFTDWRTELVVELRDDEGRLLAGPLSKAHAIDMEGLRVLHARIPAERMALDITTLKVTFAFDETNQAPHPDFKVDSRICLHYIEQEPVTACSL